MPRNDGPIQSRFPFTGPKGPDGALSRRELFAAAGMTAGGLALAPLLPRSLNVDGLVSKAAPAPSSATFGKDLDNFILGKMQEAHLPAFTGVVTRGDNIRWSHGYGMANFEEGIEANQETVFILASISKTFIMAAVMQLWEQSMVDLDADVNTYLPFEVRNPDFPADMITLRMLLTHTSSIYDRYSVWGTLHDQVPQGYCFGDATIPLGQWLADYLVPGGAYYIADKNWYNKKPGDAYHYSNIGADLAAYVVEYMSGIDFATYVHQNILEPLGMNNSGFHLTDIGTSNMAMPYRYQKRSGKYFAIGQYGYPDYPSGMMRTSAAHLSIWMRCLQNGGIFEGVRILEQATMDEVMRPQIPGNWWQGLILYRERRGGQIVIGHGGSDYGAATNMFWSTEKDVGVVGFGSRYLPDWTSWYAARDIQNRLFDIA